MMLTEIRDVIHTRFKREVAEYVPVAAVYDNDTTDAEPDAGELWVRWTVWPTQNVQVTFGASENRHRMTGIAVATIHGPPHRGTYDVEAIADVIISAFRAVTESGVKFETPTPSTVGRGDKGWEMTVSCPWRADHVAA